MQKPIVIFDLDGTLVDSLLDILDSLNYCLKINNFSHVNFDLRPFIGKGSRFMIKNALVKQGFIPTSRQLDKFVKIFLNHYRQNIPGKTCFFSGVVETLENLEKAGFLLAICTNKHEQSARILLHALDKKNHYSAICGGDSFMWKKPDPRHLLSTIEKANGDINHSVMVGDSAIDILTAKAAKIPIIAVNFGYSYYPIMNLFPTAIINNFSELTVQRIKTMT